MTLRRSAAALLAASAASSAAAAPPPPGKLCNLSSDTLQLPVAGKGGGVEEISAQPLAAGYSSAYFFTDPADDAMTFFCPQDGAHTSGSSFPRSELRQQPDWDLRASGRHVLNATVSVEQTTATKQITIGQAHIDGVSGHCSIFVELEWADGDVVAHLRDKNCNGVSKTVGSGLKLGDKFSYSIAVAGDAAVVTTDRGGAPMAPYAYSWLPANTPVYFKAGDYLQDSGSSATLGGKVKIYALSTSHSQ